MSMSWWLNEWKHVVDMHDGKSLSHKKRRKFCLFGYNYACGFVSKKQLLCFIWSLVINIQPTVTTALEEGPRIAIPCICQQLPVTGSWNNCPSIFKVGGSHWWMGIPQGRPRLASIESLAVNAVSVTSPQTRSFHHTHACWEVALSSSEWEHSLKATHLQWHTIIPGG